jgi:hypothetical protein
VKSDLPIVGRDIDLGVCKLRLDDSGSLFNALQRVNVPGRVLGTSAGWDAASEPK